MTKGIMAANLRGQLGVKSGPLAPTSSKYTTQLLVVSHMENHYKKISKARPAIDNGPPKSMLSSQKLRDRRSRKQIEKYGSRPTSRLTYRPASAEDIYDESQWEEPENEEERQVRDIMRTTLRVPLKAQHGIGSTDATAGSRSESAGFGTTTTRPQSATLRGVARAMQGASYMGRNRPMSARSTTSLASNFSQTSRSSNPLKVTYDGDVLNKHAHSFTEPSKPFTPRTLKSNRESRLKQYKYYTPPPPKKMQVSSREEEPAPSSDTKVKEVAPQAKPRGRASKGGGDLGATETLTETMLMDMSLQSHDPRQRGDESGVPRLDITMDKDHLSWVKEQASRAQIRTRSGTSAQPQDLDRNNTLGQTGGTLGDTDTLRFTRTGSSLKSFGVKTPTSRRLGQAEEEQKYVAFAHEVTQDIVSRGICSDRVLQMVFDNHIERKKDELDERRLRAIITDIRRDLGVQNVGPVQTKTVQYSDNFEQAETQDGEVSEDTVASGSTSMLSTSRNTYEFGRTTDMLSTIHSQADDDDPSGRRALQQYEMSLTVKDNAEESSGLDHTLTTDNDRTLRTTLVNGDMETRSADGSEKASEAAVAEPPRPAARQRRHLRQDASTAGQENVSSQASVTDTDAKTEEGEEEYEYEDDYDADEDDGQDAGTQKGSDDDF